MIGADDYDYLSSDDDENRYTGSGKTRRPSVEGCSNDHMEHAGQNSISREILAHSSGGEVSGYIIAHDRTTFLAHSSPNPDSYEYQNINSHEAERKSLLGKGKSDDKYISCKKKTCVQTIFVVFGLILGLSGWVTFTVFQLKHRPNTTAPVVATCSVWSQWGDCSVTCGVGTQTRSRTCNGNSSQYWVAEYHDSQGCTKPVCKAHGNDIKRRCANNQLYSALCTEWSPWGSCSVTCGVGSQTRLRKCQGNSTVYWEADYHDSQGCTQPICKADCDDWSVWGDCSVTCGQGSRLRSRKCYGNSSEYWESVYHDSEYCTQPICTGTWSEWNLWGSCNSTCGCGVRTRNRQCSNEYCGSGYVDYLSCDKSCNGQMPILNTNNMRVIALVVIGTIVAKFS